MIDLREFWFKLPLKLRQRYWRETGYSRLPPSPELWQELEQAIKAEVGKAGDKVSA